MPRGLKPSTMKAAHGFEKLVKNFNWLIISAVILITGYMLHIGKSPEDLADNSPSTVRTDE